MSIKPLSLTALMAALLPTGLVTSVEAQAPAPTSDASTVVSPGQLSKLFNESEAAFAAKDYATGVSKIKELLKALGTGKEAPYETLYFYIGLGNLLGGNLPEAEAGFEESIKRYPKGEYTSRAYLGLGRAYMLQDTPEKKEQAIKALRSAATYPTYRSEAGLWLGQVLSGLGRQEESLKVFRSLMGSDVRTAQQTTAAVEAIGLLAELGKIEDLYAYLERLANQSGVRDAIAWYTNQTIVRGDQLISEQKYDAALAIYRSVPPRSQILETQATSLASMRKDLKILENRLEAERNRPLNQHTNVSELVSALKPAIELADTAMKAIEEKADLDAALIMRRGRCLFYLERDEEALVCFRTLRAKYVSTPDAEAASFAEIIILNKRKDIEGIKEKCELFMRKFPQSERLEQVSTLAGEMLVQSGNWKEVGSFYRGLETKFPQSESLERYIFFQALPYFMEANFKESAIFFEKFLKNYPNSPLVETGLYYVAMSNFFANEYKKTLASCRDYLTKFPNGRYAGDMQYRLSFIDFNDKEIDQTDKIIRDLQGFLKENPTDLANGSMYCLLADTYKKKIENSKTDEATKANEDFALEAYKNAVDTESPDDVIQYALESATNILQGRKDWDSIAKLHGNFLDAKPNSSLALVSATWVAKSFSRAGRASEAAELLAKTLQAKIADPNSEQVEFLIDELVKSMVPRKKAKDIDADALDKQLLDLLTTTVEGIENSTTAARVYYARARLAEMVKRRDRSDLYIKGIASTNANDPSGLSPALLAVCGDVLLKHGDLEGAEKMYRRLADRYHDSAYSDAGPVGLGFVAMAQKKYDEALTIFETVLENNAGTSRIKETTLGKLQALTELGKLDVASTLALEMVGDKLFRGETAAKAYIALGSIYRKQAAKASGEEAKTFLAQAHGTYQRIYVAYQGFPDICADAYWKAYEVLTELNMTQQAQDTLKALAEHPKLKNTAPSEKASEMVN